MTRISFDERLVNLRRDIIDMGAAVESALDEAMSALFSNDRELAAKVVANDSVINQWEDKIHSECVSLIATQQPLARDLRLITATLKMVTDLERIGDHASDISDITVILGGEENYSETLRKMAETSFSMVKDALNSFVTMDASLAQEAAERDEIVDSLFEKNIAEYETIMRNHPESIDISVKYLFAAKYLERIGDHATNIAEWVLYCITGQTKRLN